ncbi:MAG: class D beta-lactamase [Phycisphaerales bacterium]|nr:class D beta-lactamase [Phycisphaerales bacterium]MCB9858044.1 class D beta-lactamase [Phycisphaerales bacterium]MCB9864141.1 class D beta-lactamase [Phycisphaerales bacterium]
MHLAIAIAIASQYLNVAVDPDPAQTTLELDHYFKGYDACFVLLDLNTGVTARYNPERCGRRFSPCSTFKIPNAAIGLETGVLTGPDHEMKWDGVKHHRAACNRDQTLRTAVRDSVLWYFQRVASGVGAERMQKWLNDADYGNKDMSGGLTQFWLDDSLKISADEQVRFLKKLHDETLPISKVAQHTVKEILIVDQSDEFTLRGKTGTKGDEKSDVAVLGWFVGTVTSHDATYVFACNISAKKDASGPTARRLAISVLQGLNVIPKAPKKPQSRNGIDNTAPRPAPKK